MIPILNHQETQDFLAKQVVSDSTNNADISTTTASIIRSVKENGDNALIELANKFGDARLEQNRFQLSEQEIITAINRLPKEIKTLLETSAKNIRDFATATVNSLQPFELKRDGYSIGMRYEPVDSVVCYVPAGRYPLPSTALMTTLTAQAAGVQTIYLTSPKLNDEIIYAGSLAGVTTYYQCGGAQAVAAFAYGTASIPKSDMFVGPGNAYVTEAKQQLQGHIGIDLLAGPSEVTIIADEYAHPDWLALDMLAQAEHDPKARSFLFTTSQAIANETQKALQNYCETADWLPDFIQQSLKNSLIGLLETKEDCINLTNTCAPEHLELHVRDPEHYLDSLKHYGALFIGNKACVSFGDYMAGPNHTLPTARRSRFQGGLTPLTFLRAQTWMRPTGDITALAQATANFATLEALHAHSRSARNRI